MTASERRARSDRATRLIYDAFISYSHAADDLLAPRLHAGLQRFAKPWWKRRAIRVFRDEASLAANPHLWSSITQALDDSDWFVLLLSPDAAASEWVGREVEHWTANKDPGRILPVVTDGTFGWHNGDVTGTSVPPALHGVFTEEPRWVDLRFARNDESLDLQNPEFSNAVADIASAVRGVPKDELASEEVRQHRRTIRTAWAAGVVVVLLGVAAAIGAVVAVGQSNEAREQRDEAERLAEVEAELRVEAEAATAEAERLAAAEATARADADREAERARTAEAAALEEAAKVESSRLASEARFVAESNIELAILLTLEALDIAPTESLVAEHLLTLRALIPQHRLVQRIDVTPGNHFVGLSPDGGVIYHSSNSDRTLRAIANETGRVGWDHLQETGGPLTNVSVSPDGELVSLTVVGDESTSTQVLVFDAASGDIVQTLEPGDCDDSFAIANQFSPSGQWLSVVTGTERCEVDPGADWAVVYNTSTWMIDYAYRAQRPERRFEAIAFSEDSDRILRLSWDPDIVGGTIDVVTFPGLEPVEAVTAINGSISPSGELLAFVTGERSPIVLWDVDAGVQRGVIDTAEHQLALPKPLAFSPDGSTLSAIFRSLPARTISGNSGLITDADDGSVLLRMHGPLPTVDQAWSADGSLLITSHEEVLLLWDVKGDPQREFDAANADDPVAMALDTLTRPFTQGECFVYKIDPCSTLEEMRERS